MHPELDLHPHGRAAVLAIPLIAGVAALAVLATATNQQLFRAVNGWPATTGDALWINLTVLGESSAVLALSATMFARRRTLAWAVVFAAVLLAPAVHWLKGLLDLARPVRLLGLDAVHVIGPVLQQKSFPSGHTTTAFAAAAVAWSLFPSRLARAAVLVAAALAGLSRVAVGAHWPLDVLCGALLGWLGGCGAVRLASRYAPRAESRWHWIGVVLPLAACARILLLPEARSPRLPLHFALFAVALAAGVHGLLSRRPSADAASTGFLPVGGVRAPADEAPLELQVPGSRPRSPE